MRDFKKYIVWQHGVELVKSSELFDKTYALLNIVQKELNVLLSKLK